MQCDGCWKGFWPLCVVRAPFSVADANPPLSMMGSCRAYCISIQPHTCQLCRYEFVVRKCSRLEFTTKGWWTCLCLGECSPISPMAWPDCVLIGPLPHWHSLMGCIQCVCMCVCLCFCLGNNDFMYEFYSTSVCMYVCVCERERERKRESKSCHNGEAFVFDETQEPCHPELIVLLVRSDHCWRQVPWWGSGQSSPG